MNAWWAQTRAEVRMTLRRGETLLLTVGIPLILLVFLSKTSVVAAPKGPRIAFLAPGILALCVLSTSLVALSIATGFERQFGVLRRLHVTPLGQRRLIAAKIAGVLVTEVLQVAILSVAALLLGWRPATGVTSLATVVAALLLGSAGCAGIGLALAGRLRAEVNLAASNGLYLLLLLVSGIVVPLSSLPGVVRDIARALPSGAMAQLVRTALLNGAHAPASDWIALIAWAVIAPLLAAKTFRFD
jgi:ABC-2 type transport system permease protein